MKNKIAVIEDERDPRMCLYLNDQSALFWIAEIFRNFFNLDTLNHVKYRVPETQVRT